MGHSDGTSLLYLLLEERYDTAVRAQDIAEASGHELGFTSDMSVLDSLV